jgi:hypothetical protein
MGTSFNLEHIRCRKLGPYAIHIAGVMKRDSIMVGPHTVVVDSDGHWFIEPGHLTCGFSIDELAATVVAAGMSDAHAHIWNEEFLPNFTAFGITEVRDLGSPRAVRTCEALLRPDCSHPYPRLIFGGPMLHRPGPSHLASAAPWDSAIDIRNVIQQAVKEGAKWQKLYHGFPDRFLRETILEAHELGLHVAMHPRPGGASSAIDAGVDEIEHVACLAWDLVGEGSDQSLSSAHSQHPVHRANSLWASDSMSSVCPERFLSVTLCPTLVVQQQLLNCIQNDFLIPDAPVTLVTYWRGLRIAQPWTARQLEQGEIALEHMLAFVRQFVAFGGHLVIGSDSPNPGVLPGRSLWQELDLLRKTGLSPLELYHCASILPEGLPSSGEADLAFIDRERAVRAEKDGAWGTEPIDGVLLRGCLYQISRKETT